MFNVDMIREGDAGLVSYRMVVAIRRRRVLWMNSMLAKWNYLRLKSASYINERDVTSRQNPSKIVFQKPSKLESNQQNHFRMNCAAWNALNESWRVSEFARYGYRYLSTTDLYESHSYNDKKKKEETTRTHALTRILQRKWLACIQGQRDLPEFIYCLIT